MRGCSWRNSSWRSRCWGISRSLRVSTARDGSLGVGRYPFWVTDGLRRVQRRSRGAHGWMPSTRRGPSVTHHGQRPTPDCHRAPLADPRIANRIIARRWPIGGLSHHRALVPIMLRLVLPLYLHPNVLRLLPAQLGQPRPELAKVQARHLLVQPLRQHVLLLLVLARIAEQLDLRHHLIREARRHHETWMSGCTSEIHQAPLGEDHHRV